MIIKGQVFFDAFDNKVEVKEVFNNTFLAIVFRLIKCTFNGRTTETINSEEKTYKETDIGIYIFYNQGDFSLGREIVNHPKYKWNKDNINQKHDEDDRKERENIIRNAPGTNILTVRDREKLIRSYSNKELQDEEENEFYRKYRGLYFGRMDFDLEYYKNTRPDLWKEHYYEKVYVGKHGIKDANNKEVIIDWRTPVGGFFNETKNRFYDPEVDKLYSYNYELIMKRRFADDGRYSTVFIADGEMYKDGDMDPFLIEVLTRLRRNGNDKAVDIIETIQAGQNAIVRESFNTSFYVQGCAGSGKTMILLHRLSCLLYNNKNLDTSKIKIITPNENIISQLRELSAELEISSIEQMTIEKYFLYLISKYSRSIYEIMFNNNFRFQNEALLSQEFLEYVYGDACIERLNNYYSKYFDDISSDIGNYIKLNNNYNVETLREYAVELFNLRKQLVNSLEAKHVKEKEKEILVDQLKAYTNEYDNQIKSNKNLVRIEKKLNTLKTQKQFIDSLSDEIEELNLLKKELDELLLDKDIAEQFLKEFYYLKDDSLTETILFRSIAEVIDAEKKNKDTENIILKTIEKYSFDKDECISKLENMQDKYKKFQAEYQRTGKLHLIKRIKLSSAIKQLEEEISNINFKINNIDRDKKRKENELNGLRVVFNNIRYNGKVFIEKKMKELLNAEKSLSARIKVKGNKINSSLKKYKVTIADIDSITLELEIEIEETEKEIYNENQSLIELKNNMANIENQIIKINDKIAELFPYTVQEEKSIAKQCNKFLSKDENGNFEPKLKFSDYRFVLDILEPFKEEVYDIFTIENNDAIYKHNLYFILFLLIKMYGEKSVNTMVNIDEAQDISVNEYELIRKANINSIFNLYGDTNQLLFKNRGIEKWELLGNYNLKGFKLNINYRNVSSITKYCNENLSPLSMEAMGVEGDPVNEISINNINDFIENRCYIIVKDKTILDKLRIRQEYNFIEKKDDNISDTMLNIMTVEMAKGMEFSNVIVVDIGMNKREKYVAYTRALNKLIVAR